MEPRIVITGNKGFIGSYLSKRIKAIGLDIKDEKDILTCYLPNADVVIHLAAQTDVIQSLKDPMDDAFINILGTIRLADRYKNKRIIFASSGGAIQKKIGSPYGLSKLSAEEYIKLICKDYVILRLPNIYGDGSRSVVDKFIKGKVKIHGDGKQTRDYVHVEDIVEAIIQSIKWKKGTYYLGSEKNISVLNLAKATGKKINFLPERKGEIKHSKVKNNTAWKPKINVINYINDSLHIRSI